MIKISNLEELINVPRTHSAGAARRGDKGHRKEKHKIPRNLVRRRRRKIRRIPVQRRRYRSWASPGPAKRRRYLAAAVKLGDGLSAVGPRASWCGYGDALWKKHRAGRARVHRGTHGFEFNRPWPEPESLSAFREGHWGSIISILPFLLENVTSLLE